MVKKQSAVPDAWEDDWEAQADKQSPQDNSQPSTEAQAPKSKSERLAQHAESNRKLWESAESAETFHYLEATTNNIPLASNFKPQVKVLSRRPVIAKKDPVTGMSQMTLDDDETPKKEATLSPEEVRAKQKRDREEKQRRYDEARAKIFGESASSSGASTPGTVTPPRSDGQTTPRGRGRGRGGGTGGSQRVQDSRQIESRRTDAQPSSGRELYDPNYSAAPESATHGRGDRDSPARSLTPRTEQAPIRNPRGPDASGRGGFNLARRGAKEG